MTFQLNSQYIPQFSQYGSSIKPMPKFDTFAGESKEISVKLKCKTPCETLQKFMYMCDAPTQLLSNKKLESGVHIHTTLVSLRWNSILLKRNQCYWWLIKRRSMRRFKYETDNQENHTTLAEISVKFTRKICCEIFQKFIAKRDAPTQLQKTKWITQYTEEISVKLKCDKTSCEIFYVHVCC